jgi:DUF4097 and DUF4098 domain-containing protein YvlB
VKQRGSIVGPLILITIGVLFLMRTAVPSFSLYDFFASYWPYLLILWGALQILEITVRMLRGVPLPANGITAGGWFLVLVIAAIGFATFEVRDHHGWWRRVGFDQGMDWFGEPHDYPIAEQSKEVGRTPRIVLEAFRGSVKVTGADTTTLKLSGRKTIRAMKDGEAREASGATPVELVDQGNTVVLRCNQQRATGRVRVTTDLELTVPRGATLQASGDSGDFDVTGLNGDVKISSDNAGVRIQDVDGNVSVDTRRGDVVRCTNIKGSVDLRGRSSDVQLEKIAGQVTINGAYSGTITLRALAKPLHLDNFQTTLIVQKVNGQITMDRGSFSAQDIVGPAQLSTHATDVEIAGFTSALQIRVDKGDVSLRPVNTPLSPVTVRTGSGNIDLALPDAAKFDLIASTDRGEIANDFGSPLKKEQAGRGARLAGVVGAGPNLSLNTDRGSITVRKGSEEESVRNRHSTSPSSEAETEVPEAPKPPAPPKDAPRPEPDI